jgi:predicted transcriptional regulator
VKGHDRERGIEERVKEGETERENGRIVTIARVTRTIHRVLQ